jgi:hypothetical protein
MTLPIVAFVTNGAFALDVKLMLNENLGGILDGTQCQMDDNLMLSKCKPNLKFSW